MNEWDFRPPLCTYKLNWTSRASWGSPDEWYDTALQIQDSKFEPCGRARHLPLTKALHNTESVRVSGEEIFVSLKPECQSGGRTHDLRLSNQAALITAPKPPPVSWEYPRKCPLRSGCWNSACHLIQNRWWSSTCRQQLAYRWLKAGLTFLTMIKR